MISAQHKHDSLNKKFLTSKVNKDINLIQNAPISLFQMGINGYFNHANQETKDLLKVDGYDVYRTNIFDFLDPKSTKDLKQKIQCGKKKEKLIFEFILKENNDFNYQVVLTPEFNGNEFLGTWYGAISILPFMDKKKFHSLKELETLKKSHEHIKNQLAHLCHEVRIPINTIMGMSYLLAANIDESTKQKYLEPLFTSADYLEKLVSAVLDFSKMEGGHMDLHEENYSLNQVLNEIQDAFKILLKNKPVELLVENTFQKDEIFGDALRLKQILSNLLNNACKFTTHGKVGIRALPHQDENSQPMVRFEVWDTGIGIPEHKLNSVFEEYKQADTQIAAKYGGTGLGLSIVQQLVQLHGGAINIKSKEGEGTIFIVDIPYKTQAPRTVQVLPKENTLNRHSIKGKKILVFEDDLMGKKLIQNILKRWECKFEILQNGFFDIKKIEEEAYDLILMDINLPGKNGYEITEQFRAQGINTPVIALTGSSFAHEKERAFNAGMNDFVSKPISFSDLEKVVTKWIYT